MPQSGVSSAPQSLAHLGAERPPRSPRKLPFPSTKGSFNPEAPPCCVSLRQDLAPTAST